ncbi:MAG: hypothetical protein SWY16_13510 [Cyanobacteriota bacterium]|nr:hypothetical protein [Cyanobacteriota bacterium]
MNKIIDEAVETSWRVESHGSLYIFLNAPVYRGKFFYWRLDALNPWSLLNIDVSEDGYITTIEVITYNRPIENIPEEVKSGDRVRERGSIELDTSQWMQRNHPSALERSKFIENSESFHIQMDELRLRIELLRCRIARIVWTSNSLYFELNELNEICGIVLTDFIGQERKIFVRKMQSSAIWCIFSDSLKIFKNVFSQFVKMT